MGLWAVCGQCGQYSLMIKFFVYMVVRDIVANGVQRIKPRVQMVHIVHTRPARDLAGKIS
jgi:hypothetical protein